MRKLYLYLLFILLSVNVFSQDCTILSKANNIAPDRLCSPVTASWNVSYTGVNNVGTPVQIRYVWGDGTIEFINATNTGIGLWEATSNHIYTSNGNFCNYMPTATLFVNGVECSSSTQQQIVTVWDDDDHNGGIMRINPAIYPICFGDGANVQFRDVTQFNCVPPQENDVPNTQTRWVQWIYGTDITMTGLPITVNGTPQVFPYSAPIITLLGPVTGSGVLSDIINVANDKQIGEYFEVTLRNWNYCNPYDDPNIPGAPLDPINGDNPPVITTAIILIVPLPDATIIPMDTLCIDNGRIDLTSVNGGGVWTGNGVIGNRFDPRLAGIGNHTIRYTIVTPAGCTDWDETIITVLPAPIVNITPVGTVYANNPPITLISTLPGGIWSGAGVSIDLFIPSVAGIGTHIIMYETLPDNNGCIGFDTIHIQVIMPPIPIAHFYSDSLGCSPLSIQFINNSLYGETYLWDFGDKTYSTEMNPLHIFYVPGNYIVRLTVTNMAGQSTFVRIITVYQNPIVMFNVYPTEVIRNNQIIKVYNNTMYGDFYKWDFGDGSIYYDFEPYHQYESDGQYYIKLIVTTLNGCIDSMTYQTPVEVSFKVGILRYPNAFRWNQTGPTDGYWIDGVHNNYVFRPHFSNIIEYNLLIYNRWGELIYESNDLYKGWDGYHKGKVVMQGVYVWKATGRFADGTYFNKVGDVTFLH